MDGFTASFRTSPELAVPAYALLQSPHPAWRPTSPTVVGEVKKMR